MTFELKKGMTVTMQPTGNFKRGWDGKPRHGVVEKLGRKYAHVALDGYGRSVYRFDRETLECVEEAEYNAGYELFPDDAAYQDEMDRRFMMQEIRIRVHEGALEDLDLEQIRRIYELVAGEAIGDNTTD